MIIRRLKSSDAPAVAELWSALVAYHQALDPALPGAAPNGGARYAKRMLQKLDDPFTCTLVAEENGRVVGFVLGMIVDLMPDFFAQEPAGFLADIYVDPHYRRHGIGRALVAALQEWFRQQGVTSFDWHVAARNTAGRAFWQAMGGREVMVRMRVDLGGQDDSTALSDG